MSALHVFLSARGPHALATPGLMARGPGVSCDALLDGYAKGSVFQERGSWPGNVARGPGTWLVAQELARGPGTQERGSWPRNMARGPGTWLVAQEHGSWTDWLLTSVFEMMQ